MAGTNSHCHFDLHPTNCTFEFSLILNQQLLRSNALMHIVEQIAILHSQIVHRTSVAVQGIALEKSLKVQCPTKSQIILDIHTYNIKSFNNNI